MYAVLCSHHPVISALILSFYLVETPRLFNSSYCILSTPSSLYFSYLAQTMWSIISIVLLPILTPLLKCLFILPTWKDSNPVTVCLVHAFIQIIEKYWRKSCKGSIDTPQMGLPSSMMLNSALFSNTAIYNCMRFLGLP